MLVYCSISAGQSRVQASSLQLTTFTKEFIRSLPGSGPTPDNGGTLLFPSPSFLCTVSSLSSEGLCGEGRGKLREERGMESVSLSSPSVASGVKAATAVVTLLADFFREKDTKAFPLPLSPSFAPLLDSGPSLSSSSLCLPASLSLGEGLGRWAVPPP